MPNDYETNVRYYKDNVFGLQDYVNIKNKESVAKTLVDIMSCRTNEMFEWKGLPTTIPEHILEMQLQGKGFTIIFKYEGKIFASWGDIGGMLNYNYLPKYARVTNPYLAPKTLLFKIYYGKDDYEYKLQKNESLESDGLCVVIPNDCLLLGLNPIHSLYSKELAETKLTKNMLMVIARAMYLFKAPTEDRKDDFIDIMKSLEDGEYSCVVDDDLLVEAKTLPFAEDALRDFTALIENEQYIKASWFNDLGLQANYNMKREAINSNESQLNKDAILPFTDNMLAMRKKYGKLVNELFGESWSVDFKSAWKQSRQAMEEALEDVDPNSKIDEKDGETYPDRNTEDSENSDNEVKDNE